MNELFLKIVDRMGKVGKISQSLTFPVSFRCCRTAVTITVTCRMWTTPATTCHPRRKVWERRGNP